MPLWCVLVSAMTQQRHKMLTPPFEELAPRVSFLLVCLAFLPLFCEAVFAMPKSDTWLYITLYRRWTHVSWEHFLEFVDTAPKEVGFLFFNYFLNWISGGSVPVFRFAIGLVHFLPLIVIFRRYSVNFGLTFFLLVANGVLYGWMTNGLRQFMAVTLILSTLPWLLERKFLRVSFVILACTLLHRSCLLMLPVIFIVHGEAFNKRTLLYLSGIIGLACVFAYSAGTFENMASMAGYQLAGMRDAGDDGAHPLRIVVSAMPMVLAWMARDEIRRSGDKLINVCANMSVITCGIYVVATLTSGIMIGRLPIYTEMYNFLLLPWLVTRTQLARRLSVLKSGMIVGYLLYYTAGLWWSV